MSFFKQNKQRKKVLTSLIFALAMGMTVIGWSYSQPVFAVSTTSPISQIGLSASLFNNQNRIISNGTYEVRFALYRVDRETMDPYPSDTDAGSRIWEETQTVTIKSGLIKVFLGSVVPFPSTLNFQDGSYYVGMRIGTDSEMVPRKRLSSVPSALNAQFFQGRTIGTLPGNVPVLNESGKIDIASLPTGKGKSQLVLGNDARLKKDTNSHKQNTDTGTNATTFTLGSGSSLTGQNFNLAISGATNTPGLRFNATTQKWQFSNDGTTYNDISGGSIGAVTLGVDTNGDYVANITAGNGLLGSVTGEGSTPVLSVNILDTGVGAGSISSYSGLEFVGASNSLTLLQGCSDNDVLSWDNTAQVWKCAVVSGVAGISGSGANGSVALWTGASSLSYENQLAVSRGGTGVSGATAPNGSLLIGNGSGYTLATLTQGTGMTITNTPGSITLATTAPTSVTDDTNITGSIASNVLTLGWNGQLSTTRGGTGQSSYTAGDMLYYNSGTTLSKLPIGGNGNVLVVSGGIPTWATTVPGTAHDLLSTSHSDTTVGTVTRGGLITGQGVTPTWTQLTIGSNGQVLKSNGTDIAWGTDNNTTYTAGGTLLSLSGTTFSLKEGTMTNGRLCTYDGTNLVCDTSTSSVGHPAVTLAGTPNYLTIDGSQQITLGNINLASEVTGTLSTVRGGTGQTTYTDGQLLIGNSTGNTLTKATLTGTANQVVVTNGNGSITLSLPQSIATSSTPTFAGTTLNGGELSFLESGASPTYHTIFQPGDQSGDITYILPTVLGSAGTVLKTDASGNLYWEAATGGVGAAGTVTSVGSGSGLTGGPITTSGTLSINLLSSADGVGLTSSYSGLEFSGASNALSLIQGCANNEVLAWNDTTNVWECKGIAGVGGIAGSGTAGYNAYWSGTSVLDAEQYVAVSRGGTGVGTLTNKGVLYGNGVGAVQATVAGTDAQLLVADISGVPTFVTMAGDATIDNAGNLTISNNAVALSTNTTGNYVATITSGNGITGSASTEGANPTIELKFLTVADGVGATTSSYSGLEFSGVGGDSLSLLQGCSDNQILAWDETNSLWTCASISGVGGTSGSGTAGYNTYWTSTSVLGSEQYVNVSRGGTGISGATASNGSLLIGNGSGYTLATLTQGAGLTITNASGSITLATTAPTSVTGDTNVTANLASNTLTIGWSGMLGIARGGTNLSTIGSSGSIAYSAGSAFAFSNAGTLGQCLVSGGAGAPTWGACGASSIGDAIGSATMGSVFFAGTGGVLQQDNTNFFWDDTNNRLGIGTTTPQSSLSVGPSSEFAVSSGGAITSATGITSSGTITFSGLSTAGIVTNDMSGVLGTLSAISVATGGTGLTSVGGAGSIAYSDGSAFAFSAVGGVGRALISGGAGVPTFYNPTSGSVLFAGASGNLEQNNAQLYFDNANNRLGVGMTIPLAKLDISFSSTSGTAGTEYGTRTMVSDTGAINTGQDITYGNYVDVTRTGATGGTIDTYGSYVKATGTTGGTSTTYGQYVLGQGADINYGTKSEASGYLGSTLYGVYGNAQPLALQLIPSAYGVYGKTDGNGSTITNGYSLYAGTSASGTISNGYGLYIENIAATNGYGVYQAGTDDHNFFAGNVGIGTGTATTTNVLEVRSTTVPQLRVAYNASNYFTQSVSATGAVTFDATGTGQSFTIADNLTIGDASFDTVTVNASTWTLANDTNFVLSGGVNGLSIDGTTFSVDGFNNRIGIGTGAPNVALEVYGTTNALRLAYDTSKYATLSTSNVGELNIVSSSSAEGAIVMGNGSATDLSIQFDGSTNDYFIGRDATTANFLIGSGMTVQDSTALLNITSGGLVGIGMTPVAKLDATLTSTSITANTQYGIRSTVSDTGIVTTGTDTTYGTYTGVTRTGATGGTIDTYGSLISVTGDNAGAGTSKNIGLSVAVSGADTNYSAIFTGGNVGIGTTTPAYALDVLATGTGAIARFNSANNTGCTLATDGTITCSSDERLKKNIVTMTDSLSAVMALRPVEYNWKYQDDSEMKNFGFIAQEVESILPRLVITDVNGYKELNTIGLVPIIAQAVQEQQSQIVSINLRTDQNVTTLTELQASVDTELDIVGTKLNTLIAQNAMYDTYFADDNTRLTDHETHLSTLDTLTNQLQLDINAQISRITLLETQMQSLIDFYTAFDMSSIITKNASGDIDLTLDNTGNRVLLGGKLKAIALETGGLTIEVYDPLAPTIGTAEVLPVALDADSDGNDDYTGLPMTDPRVIARDGMSVTVLTKAMIPMVNGSRIFTTWKNNPAGFSWVEKTKDAQNEFVGFTIKLSLPVTTPTKVDWLLIEQKDTLLP